MNTLLSQALLRSIASALALLLAACATSDMVSSARVPNSKSNSVLIAQATTRFGSDTPLPLLGPSSPDDPYKGSAAQSCNCPCQCTPQQPAPPTLVVPAPPPKATVENRGTLVPSTWNALPGWNKENPYDAWDAFLKSCSQLRTQITWKGVCDLAQAVPLNPASTTLVKFFEQNFTPYQVVNADGSNTGLVTGYYEPLLTGSRYPSTRYRFPIYKAPEDIITIDLGEVYPELRNKRLRGRLEGNKVVPYWSRGEIDNPTTLPLRTKELVWVEDIVELFFLHIQGSGRVQFDNGEVMRVGYAEQNGHPFRSVARQLIDRGELTLAQTSMQGIKQWARNNPSKVQEMLNGNPSYVFFKELPNDLAGPIGTLGVPLTAERSIAVDARVIPLGSPVYLATTHPNTRKPLNRLMLAQDTGGAINGAVRADFFWGYGDAAGKQAGVMKQSGQMWVLLPKDYNVTPSGQ